jgi:hypothetical protein
MKNFQVSKNNYPNDASNLQKEESRRALQVEPINSVKSGKPFRQPSPYLLSFIRVTGWGEFSPLGRLFTFVSYY